MTDICYPSHIEPCPHLVKAEQDLWEAQDELRDLNVELTQARTERDDSLILLIESLEIIRRFYSKHDLIDRIENFRNSFPHIFKMPHTVKKWPKL